MYLNDQPNFKHIMWCYTLVYMREALAQDAKVARYILEFVKTYE